MKKILKSAVGVLLILAMIFSCLAMSVSANNKLTYYGRTELSKMNNGAALVSAYDTIYNSLMSIDMPQSINLYSTAKPVYKDEIGIVIDAFSTDHPEFFWFDGAYSASYEQSTSRIKSVTLKYVFEGESLETAKSEFNAVVEELTRGLYGKTEYEKAKILYDRLILHNEYQKVGYHQTAYGALVNRKSVCAGYSAAYQLLLNKVGISAWTVSGDSVSPSSGQGGRHGWNIVNIDGKDYISDVTWDDGGSVIETARYDYFCTNISEVKETHIPDPFFASVMNACTATESNYFVKNSLVFDDYDADRFADVLAQNGLSAWVYCKMGAENFYDSFSENYRYIGMKIGINITGYVFSDIGNTFYLKLKCSCKHANIVSDCNYEYHWNKCTSCGMFFDRDIHRYSGVSNKCVSCDYRYVEEKFTLTYNANGGSGAPSAQSGGKSYIITDSKPVRNGYTFLGWSLSKSATFADYSADDTIILDGDTTLYAVWQKNPEVTYKLSYNANGGSGAPSAQTGSKSYIVSYTKPVKEGYVFLGWSMYSNSTSPSYNGGNIITLYSDTTLYAVWQKEPENTYTLTYNANGGSNAPSAQTGKNTYTVSYSQPIRSGYTFLGWSEYSNATAPSYYGGNNITLSSDTTLYAVWQIKSEETYKLVYNANGGTGTPSAQTGSKSYIVTHDVPSRNGYTFLGWSTYSYATSPNFYGGNIITLSADTTLYAVWQLKNDSYSKPSLSIKNNPGTQNLSYGDTIRLTVDIENKPVGSSVYWYIDGRYLGEGEVYNLYCNSGGSFEITAVLVDSNGEIIENSDGSPISDSETLNVKSNIFLVIIAFFRSLFGMSNLVVQSFSTGLI